jgi:ribulose-5-phosphate 4-epimerase/fuculose-1-phosphate aldolase
VKPPTATSLRQRIVEVAQRLRAQELVVGTSGNVSAREPGTNRCWITPSGVDYDRLEPTDLVLVDSDGQVRDGNLKPSSDTPVHLAVYRNRPEVDAVIHTHSPYATAFSVAQRDIPPVLVEAAGFLGGSVRSDGTIGRDRAVLLPNHGVLAVGETIDAALAAAVMVEHMARVALLATLLGDPHQVPKTEIERVHAFLHTEYGQR